MAVTHDWWGSLNSEDYIGCEPNPLPRIKQLNTKYGYKYVESIHRSERIHPRPGSGSSGQGGGNTDE